MPLRTVFMGTAELACASLQALRGFSGCNVLSVVTQPDKARGRDLKVQPSPVKALALVLGIPVMQPLKARDESFIEELRGMAPDLIVVAAYGQILPPALLALPKYGALNVHTSLLPRHRGAAPIQWAILEGDRETGVTIMLMDAGLDTGPILSREKTPILASDTSQTLHDRLATMGALLLLETISPFINGNIVPQTQPVDGATYARKITKEDGLLNWSEPAEVLWNKVRAFTPWPGAWTLQHFEGKARILKVWTAEPASGAGAPGQVLASGKEGLLVACGRDALRISVLQREGGKRLPVGPFLAGNPIVSGERLG